MTDLTELVARMKAQEPRKTGWLIHKAGRKQKHGGKR